MESMDGKLTGIIEAVRVSWEKNLWSISSLCADFMYGSGKYPDLHSPQFKRFAL